MNEQRPRQATGLPVILKIHEPDDGAARDEIARGLLNEPAFIAPKFFYDSLGSKLFEAICELPEYPLTREERSLLDRLGPLLARDLGTGKCLIDLGAGNCAKAERLFGALQPSQYVAVDVAADFLTQTLTLLQQRHCALRTVGLIEDFTRELVIPSHLGPDGRIFFYPGSSIGNFTPPQAREFLRQIRLQARASDALVMGVDLVRGRDALLAAYDDALGVTAAFNLNLLRRVNRTLGANFDLTGWGHAVRYNDSEQRIEMYLACRRDAEVRWQGASRKFREGDLILTEYSCKYRLDQVSTQLEEVGWRRVTMHASPQQTFAVAVAYA